MTQADRSFDFAQGTEHIIRRIRAADGSPGVRTEVAGLPVFAYDAHPGMARGVRPGALISRRQGAVLVGTGDGSVWLGHLRHDEPGAVKLPATSLLGRRLRGVPNSPLPAGTEPEVPSYRQVRYRRTGRSGGWPSTSTTAPWRSGTAGGCSPRCATRPRRTPGSWCCAVASTHSATASTSTSSRRPPTRPTWPGPTSGRINDCAGRSSPARGRWSSRPTPAAPAPAARCSALGADVVAARSGVVLNPHYDLGLYGADLHTYTLPRRVGGSVAERLLTERLPVGAGTPVAGARRRGRSPPPRRVRGVAHRAGRAVRRAEGRTRAPGGQGPAAGG